MAPTASCPQCGAPLPPDAPAGLCPKCLMGAGLGSNAAVDAASESTVLNPPRAGFIPPSPEELAKRFPHLEIQELLGRGGMGAVYKARQPRLDRYVALKILPPELGRDPSFAERFSREARVLARLNHPQIVAVYDFGQSGDLCYFLMEYVDGTNLRQVIDAQTLQPAEALAIVPQICEALQYAHEEGIVHRDIKPENILLDKRGRVKIADFGLSKLIREGQADVSLTGTHQVMGTVRYMAPEQMQGTKAVDHRADIYSLGVVFYELLTGEVPMGRFDPPSKKVEIDVRLDEVVLKALEQQPEKRYQRASEVKTDVEAISNGAGVVRRPSKGETAAATGPRVGTSWRHCIATYPEAIKLGLLAVYMIAFLLFFHNRMSLGDLAEPATPDQLPRYNRIEYAIGWPSPWFEYRKDMQRDLGFTFGQRLWTPAWLIAAAGFGALWLTLYVHRPGDPVRVWERPELLGGAWFFTACGLVLHPFVIAGGGWASMWRSDPGNFLLPFLNITWLAYPSLILLLYLETRRRTARLSTSAAGDDRPE